MREGIDVSSYQHPDGQTIDYGKVRAFGVEWAAVKITEGLTYVNPWAPQDCAGFAAAGIEVVPYHFAQPDQSDAAAQARFFAEHCPAGTGTVTGALDLEVHMLAGPEALAQWVEAFRVACAVPILYADQDFHTALIGAGYEWPGKLWLAAPSLDTFPDGAYAWQYGEGDVDGVAATVDRDQITDKETPTVAFDAEEIAYLTQMADDITGTIAPRTDKIEAAIEALTAKVDALQAPQMAPGTLTGTATVTVDLKPS